MKKLVYGFVCAITIVAMSLNLLAQTQSKQKAKRDNLQLTAGTPVTGSGTVGRISKWLSLNSVGDSNITEDKFGKVGIGTTTPTSPLTVQGMIETTLGGYKFPDGTMQTTAGLASVFRDSTLKGNGTQASPLGIAFPLRVDTFVQFGSVIEVSNGNVASHGITATGGVDGGVGVRGYGGNANLPGYGVLGVGGNSSIFSGG